MRRWFDTRRSIQTKASSGDKVSCQGSLTTPLAMSEARSLYHHEPALLQGLVRAANTPAALRDRARMVLLAVAGLPSWEIAERLAYTVATVRQWLQRFNREGVLGLFDRPRRGAPCRHPVG